jgi:hypothetical protein
MGIWKTIKAAFGRGTSTPPDARRLNAVDELALSASLGALADEETGWITLSEARALFGEMDQVGKASLVAFAEERESIDLFPSSCSPRGGSTSLEKQLDTRPSGCRNQTHPCSLYFKTATDEPPAMATKRRPPFDPKSFLAKIGEGRTISKYRKNQIVFSQGDPADTVFYVQKGKVKVTVVSDQGKEAVVAILGADEFCGEGCLAGQPRRIRRSRR